MIEIDIPVTRAAPPAWGVRCSGASTVVLPSGTSLYIRRASSVVEDIDGRTTKARKHRPRGDPRQGTEETREVLCQPIRMEVPGGPGHQLLVIRSAQRSR